MTEVRRHANDQGSIEAIAEAYCAKVKPLMEDIRVHADRLEYMVEDSMWPLPKYREIFYIK